MPIVNTLQQLSWSNVNLFIKCRRCFYKQQVLKMKQPKADPDCFSLNNAVDTLLKNEFDKYRKLQQPHPLMIKNKIEAIPFMHQLLYEWRNYKAGGIRFKDVANNIELFGIVDDIWINNQNELIIVDYKATARNENIIFSDANRWGISNERQISFYAFLFKSCGYKVNNTSYFIYNIANNNKTTFDQVLEFDSTILSYEIDYSWVSKTIKDISFCVGSTNIPEASKVCDYCKFEFTR